MAYRGKHEAALSKTVYRKRRKRRNVLRSGLHWLAVLGAVAFGFLLLRYFWQDIRSDRLNEQLSSAVEISNPISTPLPATPKPVLTVESPTPTENAVSSPAPTVQPTVQPTPQPTSTPETVPVKVDFQKLKKDNKDIIAWLYCEDTAINYAVVQRAGDNDYYLNHLLNGELNEKGSIFADKRNKTPFEEWNTLLYGHNMKDGSMFGCIDKYAEQEFYEQHPVMYLITPEKDYKVEICSSFLTGLESTSFEFPRTVGNPAKTIDDIKRYSYIDTGIIPTTEDKLLSFSTCYENDDERFVVIGVLRELERPTA